MRPNRTMRYLDKHLTTVGILLLVYSHVLAFSKWELKELDRSNFTLLGLTIGECSNHDILSKFGPTFKIEDEKKPSVDHLCYVSDRDGTLIMFTLVKNQCTKFEMMSRKDQFYKWNFCEDSPLVTKKISTDSGVMLGMQKSQLKKVLGAPIKESEAMLLFKFEGQKMIEEKERKKRSHNGEDKNIGPSSTVSIYMEAHFVALKLSLFSISIH